MPFSALIAKCLSAFPNGDFIFARKYQITKKILCLMNLVYSTLKDCRRERCKDVWRERCKDVWCPPYCSLVPLYRTRHRLCGFRCSMEYTVQWGCTMEYNSFTVTTYGGCCGFAIPSLLRNTQKNVSGFAHATKVTTAPVRYYRLSQQFCCCCCCCWCTSVWRRTVLWLPTSRRRVRSSFWGPTLQKRKFLGLLTLKWRQ